ncbi:MAG TPA: phosphoserine transaminase [Pseudomonadales bacterium]|nr:phosphoserine transaminase [Pseudomonadales bacterium]
MNELNFSGGPGALPESVIAETRRAIEMVPEAGLSLLGISHRSDWFAQVIAEAEANIRLLLNLSDDYAVLFLQGGATLQFSMIPMLLLRETGKQADYIDSGYWSSKAIPEARREGRVNVVWSGQAEQYRRLPVDAELHLNADAAYLHYASNETVEGLQFHRLLGRDDVLRVCDMSSDFLSRPCQAEKFGLIYAHAQKNLGPAGVTVVVLRRDLLEKTPENLPAYLDYRNHAAMHSIYNTPPVLAIYVMLLVTRWLRDDIGGLKSMDRLNRAKAESLYYLIDDSDGFYQSPVAVADRSLMNVVFRLPTPELEAEFLTQASAAGFHGLAGHRSVGGVRASLYNAVTLEATAQLCHFMHDFHKAQRVKLGPATQLAERQSGSLHP